MHYIAQNHSYGGKFKTWSRFDDLCYHWIKLNEPYMLVPICSNVDVSV